MNYIYILYQDDLPFYVGKTNNPNRRLIEHKRTYNKNIQMEIVEQTSDTKFWEEHYISLISSWGFTLKNKFRKSVGVDFHSDETKKKISVNGKGISRNKGIKHSPETRSKISNSLKGIPKTKEHVKNMSTPNIGKKKPNTSKALKSYYELNGHTWGDAISEGKKGHTQSPQSVEKRAKTMRKPINQYSLDGEFIRDFISMTEVCDIMGVDKGQLSKHLKNKNSKNCKGFKYGFK